MNYAIIESGKVTNIALADAPLAPNWIASDTAAIGDFYDGTTFSKPPPPAPVVPQQVTMRQARLALHQSGLLTQVDAAIAALPEPAKTSTKIEWEYAQTVDRASGLVPQMGLALGMTEQQIDELFILAGTL